MLVGYINLGIEGFNGPIDDVHIYNRVLSADEIKRLYKIFGTAKINISIPGSTQGLVGYWSFDGKDMAGNRALDSSGQEHNGTLSGANGMPVHTAGKFSQAVNFDGITE